MKKVIVSTSIHHPTQAIEAFDSLSDWELIVIGDKKTPKDFKLKRGYYMGPEDQEKFDKNLSDLIGWNCIMRRNFGFLLAHQAGADVIATVDDDNIPYENWGKDLVLGKEVETNHYETNLSCFDPIGATNYKDLWHRGYPPQLISKRNYKTKKKNKVKPDIQADFWDGDPDIDAECREKYSPDCKFDPVFFPMSSNKISPFNSQNTFITKKVLKNYFMIPHIGRMDDIWASYHVQSLGFKVVYGQPSVCQKRNPQDLERNRRDELMGNQKSIELVNSISQKTYRKEDFWPERSQLAFAAYQKHFN